METIHQCSKARRESDAFGRARLAIAGGCFPKTSTSDPGPTAALPYVRPGAPGLKVGIEERGDTTAGVEGRLLVVGDTAEAQELEPEALVVVHERMPGVGVFLHVVGDEGAFQRLELYEGRPGSSGPWRHSWRR